MNVIKFNHSNEKYYSNEFIRGFEVGAVRQFELDSAQKKGEWIDTGSGQECSCCHEIQYGYDNHRNYCANCGAEMRSINE